MTVIPLVVRTRGGRASSRMALWQLLDNPRLGTAGITKCSPSIARLSGWGVNPITLFQEPYVLGPPQTP